MENVETRVDSNNCCGCGGCYNICPTNAIAMQMDSEGFLSPVISDSCIDCGLCLKACPTLTKVYDNSSEPTCYAAQADDRLRSVSSSGGVFSVLAERVLEESGYVCGAAFREDWSIEHIIVDNREDLAKLRGSKYVQSDIGDCYKQIKLLLNGGKSVLFSGTPCQVAGLYSFLNRDYDKLLTVDILCHGVPSPGVWQRYLNETFDVGSISSINFRDKEAIGWSCSHCAITLKDGQKIVTNDYTKFFHDSTLMRSSCADCSHSKLDRPADITIGDWWGIMDYKPEINDQKGLTIVLLNNSKGQTFFSSVKSSVQRWKIVLNKRYNNGHMRYGLRLNADRDKFFRNLNKCESFKKVRMMQENKYDVGLVSAFFAENYGAILVAYAVYKLIDDLGYSVLMIHKSDYIWRKVPIDAKIPYEFATKHYNIANPKANKLEEVSLNNNCTQFVSGSDQLFCKYLNFDTAYLEFSRADKKRIAFGTSFGHEYIRESIESITRRQYLFNRFDHIALREKSDVLCNETFRIDADEIIDPTLLLSIEHFNELAELSDYKIKEPYILTYILDMNDDKAKAIYHLAKKMNMKLINIPDIHRVNSISIDIDYEKDVSAESFLKLYKNASFVITDSYHGTCFSVKFNKPFVSFKNFGRGALRYKMFDMLGVSANIYEDVNVVYSDDFVVPTIDYDAVNKIIAEKSEFAINWLKNALSSEKRVDKTIDFENYLQLVRNEHAERIMRLEAYNPRFSNDVASDITLLMNSRKVRRRYYIYKLLSKITNGNKRIHYKQKSARYHEFLRRIRRLTVFK